ncbi:MAG: xanthine phosphoribosyltransferase, partial [Oscillospiraceae bacterium]|nr:xanthine phosphoribosyltransferase [Oscillospiraceae bacterium]
MKELEDRIRRDGVIEDGDVLKVDGFLNHQMDVDLFADMGQEWARLFAGEGVNKILTIEASGIGIACIAAQQFGVPVVFAKKTRTKNIAGDVYQTEVHSFTHGRVSTVIVSKRFMLPTDRLLLIDDVLANGAALEVLLDLA